MNDDEYLKALYAVFVRAMDDSEKARREGLLALEKSIDEKKVPNRDIFEYGMRFVVDGTEPSDIDKILSNIVKQEKDERRLLLKTIQKEAVLSIQKGDNPRITFLLMNSYTDIPLDDPMFKKMFEGDDD
jgi:flagellar motor component MotA